MLAKHARHMKSSSCRRDNYGEWIKLHQHWEPHLANRLLDLAIRIALGFAQIDEYPKTHVRLYCGDQMLMDLLRFVC